MMVSAHHVATIGLKDVADLRIAFQMQDEDLEKSCEKCGAKDVKHRVRHTLRRLPRVLILHLKRFQVLAQVILLS